MKKFIKIISKPRLNYFDIVYIGLASGMVQTGEYVIAGAIFLIGVVISASMEVWTEDQKQGETA